MNNIELILGAIALGSITFGLGFNFNEYLRWRDRKKARKLP